MVSTGVALAVTVIALGAFTVAGVLHARGRVRTLDDYITARGSTGPAVTTATVVASVMGAWILLAPAEAGAAFGGLPAILGYAVGSAIPFLLFVPVGLRVRRLLPSGHSLGSAAVDLDALDAEMRRLDHPMTDGGTTRAVDRADDAAAAPGGEDA